MKSDEEAERERERGEEKAWLSHTKKQLMLDMVSNDDDE